MGENKLSCFRNTNYLVMHPVTGLCPEAAIANPVNFLLRGKLDGIQRMQPALTNNPAGSRPGCFIVFL